MQTERWTTTMPGRIPLRDRPTHPSDEGRTWH